MHAWARHWESFAIASVAIASGCFVGGVEALGHPCAVDADCGGALVCEPNAGVCAHQQDPATTTQVTPGDSSSGIDTSTSEDTVMLESTGEVSSMSTSPSSAETSVGSSSDTGTVDVCAADPCVHGTCVRVDIDAFECECEAAYAGVLCDEIAQPFCLRGVLSGVDAFDDVNGTPASGAFEHLEAGATELVLVFDVSSTLTSIGGQGADPSGQLRVLHSDLLGFQSNDPFVDGEFGSAFAGLGYDGITLVNGAVQGISVGALSSPLDDVSWGVEMYTSALPVVVSRETGFPELLPSTGPGSGLITLRRYTDNGAGFTDYATGMWDFDLLNGANCD